MQPRTRAHRHATPRTAPRPHAAGQAAALLALAGAAALPPIDAAAAGGNPIDYTILIKQGDPVPGVGAFVRVDNLAVNNAGQWIVEGDTTSPDTLQDQVVIRNGSLLLREGQSLPAPGGATLTSFDAITINNNGDSGWNFFLGGTPPAQDSGVYFNTHLVIQEGFVSSAPQFSPGTPYIGFFETKINDQDQFLIVASVDDPAIASSVDRAIVLVDYDAGTGSFTETVLSKEGDDVFGSPIVDFSTGPHNFALNNSANAAFIFDTAAAVDQDSGILLRVGGVNFLVALEGQPSVVPARTYGSFAPTTIDLNNNNAYAFKNDLTGSTADNTVIVRNINGFELVARKGQTVPASLGGVFAFENFGPSATPVWIADTGQVLYYADWNDPDTTRDSGLMVGLSPVLLEGITLVEDFKVIGIATGVDAFAMSDNGRFVIAEVTLEDPATLEPLNAAILIDRFPEPAPACPGDLNADGLVDSDDLGILLGVFGCQDPDPLACPSLDPDNDVDSDDLGILLGNFGTNCFPV